MIMTLKMASDSSVELPGEGQIPVAPILHMNAGVALVCTWLAYLTAAAVLAWAVRKLFVDREALPLIMVIAAAVTSNIEPIGDQVGLINWAANWPWFEYTMLGRKIPAMIVVGLVGYYAWAYYLAARLREGAPLRQIYLLSLIGGVPEIVAEMVIHQSGGIAYYGNNPSRLLGIPIYTIIQNSTLLPVVAVVIYLFATYVKGARQLWLVIAMPGVVLGYVFGTTWPVYQALGSSAPGWAVLLTAAWAVAASVGASYVALQLPELQARRETAALTLRSARPVG